jgi:uncharacterized membrane protein YhaH (DUF805 family)
MAAMQDHDPTSPRWLLFSFEGRIGRRTWWLCSAAVLIGLAIYLTAVLRIAGVTRDTTELLVNGLLLWPALAISVKRWHDRDKPGWWALIAFVPVIGWLWLLIENGMLRGSAGVNRFGEEPLL